MKKTDKITCAQHAKGLSVKPINQRPALAQGFSKYAALELDFCQSQNISNI